MNAQINNRLNEIDSKMSRVKDETSALSGRLSDLEKSVKDPSPTPTTEKKMPVWAQVLMGTIPLAAVVVGVGLNLDGKIGTLRGDLTTMGTQVTKNQEAIKTLASQQPDQTQKLIQSLLATAAKGNDPKISAKATEVAIVLTGTLQRDKKAAPNEFFRSAIDTLNLIGSKDDGTAFPAKLALADYRSALQVRPELMPATTINATQSADKEIFSKSSIYFFPSNATYSNLNIVAVNGATQVLDGFHWHNVVFTGAHIVYKGGDLDLQNVRFINCTFDVPLQARPNPHANKFVEEIADGQENLSFGSSTHS